MISNVEYQKVEYQKVEYQKVKYQKTEYQKVEYRKFEIRKSAMLHTSLMSFLPSFHTKYIKRFPKKQNYEIPSMERSSKKWSIKKSSMKKFEYRKVEYQKVSDDECDVLMMTRMTWMGWTSQRGAAIYHLPAVCHCSLQCNTLL